MENNTRTSPKDYSPPTVSQEVQNFRLKAAQRFNSRLVFPTKGRINYGTELDRDGKEVEKQDNALEETDRLVQEGRGVLVVYPHPTMTDPIRVLQAMFLESEMLRSLPILSPIEIRQAEKFERELKYLAGNSEIERHKIATQHTIEKYGKIYDKSGKRKFKTQDGKLVEQGYGALSYIKSAKKAVTEGRVAMVSIDSGRHQSLYPDELSQEGGNVTPLAFFDKFLGDDAEKVAVLFIGIGLPGVTEYKKGKTDGFNIAKRMDYVIGPVAKYEDLRAVADIFDTTVDEVARASLAESVDTPFRPHPTPQSGTIFASSSAPKRVRNR